MRKRDPNAVIDQFQCELARSVADWATLTAAVSGLPARRASMDALNRAAVAFERFRSDWHIAAITRDASRFAVTRELRLKEIVEQGGQSKLVQYAHVSLPKHPTIDQVVELLDASGGNVAIPSVERWKELAARDLVEPWRAKVTGISWAHAKAAAAVIAIRNAAAHQSTRSLADMTSALGCLTHPDHVGLLRPRSGVTLIGISAYLHGPGPVQRRIRLYHSLLHDLSEDLRV